jgi:hypothetical protein
LQQSVTLRKIQFESDGVFISVEVSFQLLFTNSKRDRKGVRNRFLTRWRGFGRLWAWEDQNEQPMAVWYITF